MANLPYSRVQACLGKYLAQPAVLVRTNRSPGYWKVAGVADVTHQVQAAYPVSLAPEREEWALWRLEPAGQLMPGTMASLPAWELPDLTGLASVQDLANISLSGSAAMALSLPGWLGTVQPTLRWGLVSEAAAAGAERSALVLYFAL